MFEGPTIYVPVCYPTQGGWPRRHTQTLIHTRAAAWPHGFKVLFSAAQVTLLAESLPHPYLILPHPSVRSRSSTELKTVNLKWTYNIVKKIKEEQGLEVRKRSRMLGLSPRRSGIWVGNCTSCSRSWRIAKLKVYSPGWSVKEDESQSW